MPIIVDIKVVPSSGRQGCKLDKSDVIVCSLKSPAERNMANNELIAYLAKMLHVTQLQITIIGGTTSRKKRLKIDAPITQEELLSLLHIEKQIKLL